MQHLRNFLQLKQIILRSSEILKMSEESGTNGGSLSKNQQSNNGGISDPYFIATSDNPAASLVSTVFSGTNFVRWSRNIKRGLIAKNKEGFINGEIVKHDVVSKDYQKWKRADFMVVSWILSSMSSELADDFGYIESVVDLWRELNERFGQTNGPLVYQLKKEIDNLRQENMTIVSYYEARVRLLRAESRTRYGYGTGTIRGRLGFVPKTNSKSGYVG